MSFDPNRLARQNWSPDDLARELIIQFNGLKKELEEIRKPPEIPQVSDRPTMVPMTIRPTLQRSVVQSSLAPSTRVVSQVTEVLQPASQPPSVLAVERARPSEVRAGGLVSIGSSSGPGERSQVIGVTEPTPTSRTIATAPVNSGSSPRPEERSRVEPLAGVKAGEEQRPIGSGVTLNGRVVTPYASFDAPPIRVDPSYAPVASSTSPGPHRDSLSFQRPRIILAPPEAMPAAIQRAQDNARPIQAVEPADLGQPKANEPTLSQGRDTPEWGVKLTDVPWATTARLLGVTDDDGIPPLKTGDSYGEPGRGKGIILDFNGTSLSPLTSDAYRLYNVMMIPISGNTRVHVDLRGDYLFATPIGVAMAHAIVTEEIQKCVGTTPGQGKIRFYYMKGGSMQPVGDEVTVENWYSVVAGVDLHCAVTEMDGGISLEVLDCLPPE